jgi:methylenetetrahydrofolate reductase (NADPH)
MKNIISHPLIEETLCHFLDHPPPAVSFEFFPPKTHEMELKLWETIKELAPLAPRFVSVTFGAGGSTRERTHATLERIVRETELVPAAHLTCVGATRSEVDSIASSYWNLGVKHIVALRGDPPEGSDHYTPHPDGYAYASDLVRGLKLIADFEISVAAYPETHPEASSADTDLRHLKTKIDAGANRAITQYFFDPDLFFRFIERSQKLGIDVPIIPGILPITHFKQVEQFSKQCGTNVPKWLARLFNGIDDFPFARQLVAIGVTVEICRRLSQQGFHEFHFYTLNRAELTHAMCHLLGIGNSNHNK